MKFYKKIKYVGSALTVLLTVVSYAQQRDGNFHYKFIENKNQWHPNVAFKAEINSGTLFLEKNAFTFDFYDAAAMDKLHAHEQSDPEDFVIKHHAYRAHFVGANPDVILRGRNPEKGYYNYFLGNDRSKWASRVRALRHIDYHDIYPGIDLQVYTDGGYLKYDFIIKAGADPKLIKIQYEGLDDIYIRNGHLVTVTSLGKMIEQKPYAFQEINGRKINVPCNYKLRNKKLSFVFPKGYDKTKELVIDPVMVFATYSGSTSNNFGYTATFDKYGFLYAGSSAFGQGYPTVVGSYDVTFNGGDVDIALTKYDTTGSFLIWSTFLGGNNVDLPHSLITNADDELYCFGTTSSLNFPVTPNAYDTTWNGGTALDLTNGLGVDYDNGSDIIVAKFSADGSQLLASTYIGGTANDGLNSIGTNINNSGPLRYNYADEVRGEVMLQGNYVYIATCTRSTDFPIVGNVFQQQHGGLDLDGVIVKLTEDLSSIVWSSYLGAEGQDAIYSIAIDANNDIYVVGGTSSDSFYISNPNVLDTVFAGNRCDGFITHITGDGVSIINSTYWGSDEYDQIYFVELDRFDNVHVFGQTEIGDSTFIYNAAYFTFNSRQFVSKMSPTLDSLIWSTVFGSGTGCVNISPTAFLVDLCNKIYLSGWGGGTNLLGFLNNNACNSGVAGMDVTGNAFQLTTTNSDFYVMVLEDDASAIVYGTFFGGNSAQEHVDGGTSRFDRKGKIYQSMCAGCGGFSDMYTSPGAWSATNNSSCNNGVFKMDFLLPLVVAEFNIPPMACEQYNVNFINTSLGQGNTFWYWDFGDGNTDTVQNPVHVYDSAGTYTITLIINDTTTCNLADTAFATITIITDTTYTLADEFICPGDSVQLGIVPDTSQYLWIPSTGLSNDTIANPMASPSTTTTYTLLVDNGVCTDTVYQTVGVDSVMVFTDNDTVICSNDPLLIITGYSNGSAQNYYWSSNSNFTDTLTASPNDSSITIDPDTVSQSQFYLYFMGVNAIGCDVIDSILITISDYSITTDDDQFICLYDTIYISSVSTVPGDTLTYNWTLASEIIGATDTSHILVSPQTTTTYNVSTVSNQGCVHNASVTVFVSPLTQADISASTDRDTIALGGNTGIHAFPNPAYLYSWSPTAGLSDPSSPNPVFIPTVTGTFIFTVTITDPNNSNCSYDTTVTVVVVEIFCGPPNIYIPNAFTPNDDDHNDILRVRGNFINDLYFVVYNRWGEKVFETKDQRIGWDGIYKGRKADPGVYVYYLEAGCENKEEYFEKGNVTVIR